MMLSSKITALYQTAMLEVSFKRTYFAVCWKSFLKTAMFDDYEV